MIDLDKGQNSQSTKGLNGSKSSSNSLGSKNSTQRGGIKPGIDINVTPDGFDPSNDVTISGSIGIATVTVQGDGSVGVTGRIPVPGVPGLTANGGIVVNVVTGEVEQVSLGAGIGITEISVTIIGCDIITTFSVRFPGTTIGYSYDIYSELPGCKPKPERPGGVHPGPGINPADYPPGGSNPFPDAFKDCFIDVYAGVATQAVRCYWSFASEGWTAYYTPTNVITYNPGVRTFPPNWIVRGEQAAEGQYYVSDYRGDGLPNEFVRQDQRIDRITPSNFKDYKFDPMAFGALPLYPKAPIPETADYNVCHNINQWMSENFNTGRYSPWKIVGYYMRCPFPIVNPPTLEELNKSPEPEPPRVPLPPPPKIKDMEKCCAASTRMIRELHEFIKPQDLKNSKLPKRLIYPDGKGEEKITCLGDFIRYLILEIDAKGFQPFSLEVRDTNAAQEGNQPLSITAYSLSAALKEILQYLIDTESDGDNANNMLVRLAYECSLIHKIAAVTQQQVDNIENFLDYEVRQEQVNLPMMFNMLAGVANKKKKGIDANDEVNTEAVMSELLQQVEHPIVVTKNVSRKQLTEALLELKQTMLTGGRDF